MEKLKFSEVPYGHNFTIDKDQDVYLKVLDCEPAAINRSTKKRRKIHAEQVVNRIENKELHLYVGTD